MRPPIGSIGIICTGNLGSTTTTSYLRRITPQFVFLAVTPCGLHETNVGVGDWDVKQDPGSLFPWLIQCGPNLFDFNTCFHKKVLSLSELVAVYGKSFILCDWVSFLLGLKLPQTVPTLSQIISEACGPSSIPRKDGRRKV